MAKQRLTSDFVRHLKLLRERAGNSPHNIRRALEKHSELALSIRQLDAIWRVIEQHRKESRQRFIVQADPAFSAAIKDYIDRWQDSWLTLIDWEAEKEGKESLSASIDRELANSVPGTPSDRQDDYENWDFDPDDEDAGSLIGGLFGYADDRADDEPFFSRAAGAASWFCGTVGLDFEAIAQRFKEFPVIAVPVQVSDHHGLAEPRSLYAYLTDLRLSYVTGADLSALAMCRACTEILIRQHYTNDLTSDLKPLIRRTQEIRQFAFLKTFNLLEKVQDANDLLHANAGDIKTRDRTRTLVHQWVVCLAEMIAKAPMPSRNGNSDTSRPR